MSVERLSELVETYIAPIFGVQFNKDAVPPLQQIPQMNIYELIDKPYYMGNRDSYMFSGLANYYLQAAISGTSLMMVPVDVEPPMEPVTSTYPKWRNLVIASIGDLFPVVIKDLFISGCDDMLNKGLFGRSVPAYYYSDEANFGVIPTTRVEIVSNGSHAFVDETGTLIQNGFQSHILGGPLIEGQIIYMFGVGWSTGLNSSFPIHNPAIDPLLEESQLKDEIETILDSSLMNVFPEFGAESFDGENLVTINPFYGRPFFSLTALNGGVEVDGWVFQFDTFTDYTCALLLLAYLQIHNITIEDSHWEELALAQLAFDEESQLERDNAAKLNTFYTQGLGNTVITLNRAELKNVSFRYSEEVSNSLERIYQKIETLTSEQFDVLRRVFTKKPYLMLSLFNGL